MKKVETTTLMTEEYKGDYGLNPKYDWDTCYDNSGVIFQIFIQPDKRVRITICNDKEYLKDWPKKEFHKFLVNMLTKSIREIKKLE